MVVVLVSLLHLTALTFFLQLLVLLLFLSVPVPLQTHPDIHICIQMLIGVAAQTVVYNEILI